MRLIDADALKDVIGIPKRLGNKAISYYIDTMPTIDAEPVVHCKDCKHWVAVVENAEYGLCIGQDNYSLQIRAKDFYCAMGEVNV